MQTYFLVSAFLFLSAGTVFAQGASQVSPGQRCGETSPCAISDFAPTIGAALGPIVPIVLVLAGVFVIGAVAWGALAKIFTSDENALVRARRLATQSAVGGAIFFFVIGGGYVALLSIFGVKTEFFKLINIFSYGLVEHAYAQEKLLPNPLTSNSLYDIILSAANLAMKFFVYPSIIAVWVASGFKFIYSQGNPEGLKTARNWLLISVILTVVAFSMQGFIQAFRGTAEKILPSTTQMQTGTPVSSGTSDGRGQPASPSTPGAACERGGFNGIMGTDGTCQIGGSRGGNQPASTAGTANGQGVPADKTPGAACTQGGYTGRWVGDPANGYCAVGGSR
jgi:hypothetical protein